jgi:hypothetical protein
MPKQVVNTLAVIGALVVIMGLIGFIRFCLLGSLNTDDEMTFCTADAFICPDGTAVGRTGPNCTFTCPPVDQSGEATRPADLPSGSESIPPEWDGIPQEVL